MPIYEYKCRGCGNQFEKLILPNSPGAPACPSCQSPNLEQLISSFSASSEESRQAAFKTARKRYVKGELRDKQIAEREDMEKHHH
ncbi:MAG: FmdB family zinc ribbon protein [Terriglobia bacterium]